MSGWLIGELLLVLAATAACGGEAGTAAPPVDRPDDLSGMVVFVSERTRQPELFAMRPDGSGVVQLTAAFTALPAVAARIDVFLMNADGSNLHEFTPGVSDEAPARSPDGSRLAVHLFTDNGYDLFVIEPDGSNQVLIADGTGGVRLTRDQSNDEDPQWVP